MRPFHGLLLGCPFSFGGILRPAIEAIAQQITLPHPDRPLQTFIIFNTKFIILNTKFLIDLNAQFLV